MPSTRTTLALALLLACDQPGDDDTTAATATDSDAETGEDTSEPPTTGDDIPDEPPTDEAALTVWLTAGKYKGWPAETAIHDSTGPHFGGVRTYINPQLFDSLEAGNTVHPKGAAAVKELYGDSNELKGWSAIIKGFENSTMNSPGDGWYWYEKYGDSVYGNSFGDGTCVGCHATDHPDFKDHVLTPFPLQ